MADRLPQEVLIDILTRGLTVEDLVRYTTVSKSWYSLITSPHFISFHIKRVTSTDSSSNSNSNSGLLLVRDYDYETLKENYSLHSDDTNNDAFGVYKRLDFPFNSVNPKFRVVGCLNGVVCLADDLYSDAEVIVLWNPSIKKCVTLPKPLVSYSSHGMFMQATGFGYSALANDYKVVRALQLNITEENLDPPTVEVYELSVGCWRIIESKGFFCIVDDRSSQTFLNGAIHWLGRTRVDLESKFFSVIVSFDLKKEVLVGMKLPDSLAAPCWPLDPRCYILSVLGESLSLIHQNYSKSCIWVMKQYGLSDSWTKLFTIDLTHPLGQVFGYRRNGQPMLSVSNLDETVMVSYNHKTKKFWVLEKLQNLRCFDVENFVESLSLLGVRGESSKKEANHTVSHNGCPDGHSNKRLDDEEDKEEEKEGKIQ